MRLPVARMDRPPEGGETELFTWKAADQWDENIVLVDVPKARKVGRALAELAQDWGDIVIRNPGA